MLAYESIDEKDYIQLTWIMKAAFDDDTKMHTSLLQGGPCGYDDGSLIRKLNSKEYDSKKILLDGQIIGAYTVRCEGTEYILEMLYLNPAMKHEGLGYEVWKHIEESYRNVDKWYVETPEYSKRNYYFYVKKCGFRPLSVHGHEEGGRSVLFCKEKNPI